MTKAQKAERDDAIAKLRDWIKPGDTVYTVLEHVSRSGMQREIRVVVPYQTPDSVTVEALDVEHSAHGTIAVPATAFKVDFIHPNYSISKALGLRQGKRDGLIMGGCGMDMGFALVYELSQTLYGREGYTCVGKGKCPSAYHSNHRTATDGPERFDLVHTDGYALRHRWL